MKESPRSAQIGAQTDTIHCLTPQTSVTTVPGRSRWACCFKKARAGSGARARISRSAADSRSAAVSRPSGTGFPSGRPAADNPALKANRTVSGCRSIPITRQSVFLSSASARDPPMSPRPATATVYVFCMLQHPFPALLKGRCIVLKNMIEVSNLKVNCFSLEFCLKKRDGFLLIWVLTRQGKNGKINLVF